MIWWLGLAGAVVAVGLGGGLDPVGRLVESSGACPPSTSLDRSAAPPPGVAPTVHVRRGAVLVASLLGVLALGTQTVIAPSWAAVTVPLVAAAGAGAALTARARVRTRKRRLQAAVADHLPDAITLMAVGLRSGRSLVAVCNLIGRELGGPVAGAFVAASDRHTYGRPLIDALQESLEPLGAGPLALVPLLRSYDQDGAAIAAALFDFADGARDDRRRQAETAARRLPVHMLVPLIVCVLPAFMALTVAPVIIESLRSFQI